jgi:hypothetical protein
MSDLHREKTSSLTYEYSRRLEEAPLQIGAHLVGSYRRAPKLGAATRGSA